MITVWVDYGSEGWQPQDCATDAEAIEIILGGNLSGRIRVTRDVPLSLAPAEKETPGAAAGPGGGNRD